MSETVPRFGPNPAMLNKYGHHGAMSQSVDGAFVYFIDHQTALAEREAEIERLSSKIVQLQEEMVENCVSKVEATKRLNKAVETVRAEIRERLQAYSDRLRVDPGWPEEAADAIELAADAALGEQHE